ncbi:MAG TPA: DUF1735 domain-containing protein [Puia sp.]|jgi:hypothetical protein|nr:DUF1735 domain-containing protein [Puia sp.]
MKIKFLIPVFLFATIFLSSCLKDTPNYIQVADSAPIIEFGLSPANGQFGPFAYAGDTASGAAIDTAIALVIASPQVLTKDITITIGVDNSQIDASDTTAGGVQFTMLPSNLYSITSTTITIKAGYRLGRIPISLNLPDFPASHAYSLPLVITDGDGLIISGNSSTFMWQFER